MLKNVCYYTYLKVIRVREMTAFLGLCPLSFLLLLLAFPFSAPDVSFSLLFFLLKKKKEEKKKLKISSSLYSNLYYFSSTAAFTFLYKINKPQNSF